MGKVIGKLKEIFKIKKNRYFLIGIVIILLTAFCYDYFMVQPYLYEHHEIVYKDVKYKKESWTKLKVGKTYVFNYSFDTNDYYFNSISFNFKNNLNSKGKIAIKVYSDGNKLINAKNYSLGKKQPNTEIAIAINSMAEKKNYKIEITNKNFTKGIDLMTKSNNMGSNIQPAYKVYTSRWIYTSKFERLITAFLSFASIILFYILVYKGFNIGRLFLLSAIIFGSFYFLILIPGTVPDEYYHAEATLGYSSILMGKGSLNKPMIRQTEKNAMTYKATLDVNDIGKVFNSANNVSNNTYIRWSFNKLNHYDFISYLPQIIGVTIARLLSLNGLLTLYVGRLFAFVTYLLAVYLAIKKTPILKALFMTVALLPMALQQGVSFSYDSFIISLSFLVVSYSFDFIFGKNDINRNDIVLYIVFTCLIVTMKRGLYFPLCLLPLLISENRIKDERKRIQLKMLLLLPWIIILGLFSSGISSVLTTGGDKTKRYSLIYYLTHMDKTIHLFVSTIIWHFNFYLNTLLGVNLGWLTINLNELFLYAMLPIACFSSFRTSEDTTDFTVKQKLFFLLMFLIIYGSSLYVMSVAWTRFGDSIIQGVQGRYFLPALPLAFAIFRNRDFSLETKHLKFNACFMLFLSFLCCLNVLYILI